MNIFETYDKSVAKLVTENGNTLALLGGNSQGGTYVLRIRVTKQAAMAFGGFKRGKKIDVPAGEYTYVGSARAEQGSTCLARRLVRHASRTGGKRPQAIRRLLMKSFANLGLGPQVLLPSKKTLRWNVDHLLDKHFAKLVGVYAVRSPLHLEFSIASRIEGLPETRVIELGLGAGDNPGHTHLLKVEANEGWWQQLPLHLQALLLGSAS